MNPIAPAPSQEPQASTNLPDKYVSGIPTVPYERAMEIFRQIIAPGASPEHAALIFHYAKQLGLDPLQKQVMLLKTRYQDMETEQWVTGYSVVVGVHGITGKCAQQKDWGGLLGAAVYDGEECEIDQDGIVRHIQKPLQRRGLPRGAWASAIRIRQGRQVRHTLFVPFEECAQYIKQGSDVLRSSWKKMPGTMNLKCAKAQACRQAYADELGTVYAAEEMGGYTSEDGQVTLDPDQGWTPPRGWTQKDGVWIPPMAKAKAADVASEFCPGCGHYKKFHHDGRCDGLIANVKDQTNTSCDCRLSFPIKKAAAAAEEAPGVPVSEAPAGPEPSAAVDPGRTVGSVGQELDPGPTAPEYKEEDVETSMHCAKCTWPIDSVTKQKDGQWTRTLICRAAKGLLMEHAKDAPETRRKLIEGHYMSTEILGPVLP